MSDSLKRKDKKSIHHGVVHIKTSFNNTIVTISDTYGDVFVTKSAGNLRFKGAHKSTAFAAQLVADSAIRKAMGFGLKSVDIQVKGPGLGRESAIRAMKIGKLRVLSIRDVTPLPHNGCRPKKKRRV